MGFSAGFHEAYVCAEEVIVMAVSNKLCFMGWTKPVLALLFILLACATSQGCDKNTLEKGVNKNMDTHYIGRFAIAIPTEMKLKIRSAKLRDAEIKEIVWSKNVSSEQARTSEWERYMTEINKLAAPKDKDNVIINQYELPNFDKWVKGVFYYNDHFDRDSAQSTLLMDSGQIGVWINMDGIVVEKEKVIPKTIPNYETIVKAYQPPNTVKQIKQQPDNRFYLQYGVINLPYYVQEESIARFEGHPLITKLLIEMEMDMNHEIEPQALIKGTKAMIAAALITPGGSISKIRLGKREVAGMQGEEAVLKVREGKETDLVFTWEFNGKDDSGEYPTTRINMEAPDGNLEEKLKIWDAVLDSMKPKFVRK